MSSVGSPGRSPEPVVSPRERALLLAALALLTTLAWLDLFHLGAAMSMAAMPGMRPWAGTEFALAWLMWTVMMVGMMTPSAAPMLLTHALVAKSAARASRRFASTAWFASARPALAAGVLIVAGLYQLTALKSACLSHCRAPLRFIQHHGGFRPHAS